MKPRKFFDKQKAALTGFIPQSGQLFYGAHMVHSPVFGIS